MGFESGGFYRERPRLGEVSYDVLDHPHEVFDSPIEKAKIEALQVQKDLEGRAVHRRLRDTESHIEAEEWGRAPTIQIVWPSGYNTGMALELHPIQEGRGPEAGVFGYTGTYGSARRDGQQWQLQDGNMLEDLFNAPANARLIVWPTIDRFAIEKDRQMQDMFGDNTWTLYLGLGFLYLGHQWMHVGMHEAAHITTPDENEAWFLANKEYARRHKPIKDAVLSGRTTGLFELLQKPDRSYWNTRPTIGDIVNYGLVSHFIGGTRISQQLHSRAADVWENFQRTVRQAHDAYAEGVGKY